LREAHNNPGPLTRGGLGKPLVAVSRHTGPAADGPVLTTCPP